MTWLDVVSVAFKALPDIIRAGAEARRKGRAQEAELSRLRKLEAVVRAGREAGKAAYEAAKREGSKVKESP